MIEPRYERPCKLCGAPLAILTTADGKAVGLDLSVPIYAPTVIGQCVRTTLSYADHKAICRELARLSA